MSRGAKHARARLGVTSDVQIPGAVVQPVPYANLGRKKVNMDSCEAAHMMDNCPVLMLVIGKNGRRLENTFNIVLKYLKCS